MSWSLKLRNGDLAHDRGRYALAQGIEKIAQDLRIFILTRYGSDDMHPSFGSTIDGGLDEGSEIGSVLDMSDANLAASVVEAEIRRWATSYKEGQLERLQKDATTYGASTFRPDEILADIPSIQFQQVMDTLYVYVTIQPAEGPGVTLNLTVPTI